MSKSRAQKSERSQIAAMHPVRKIATTSQSNDAPGDHHQSYPKDEEARGSDQIANDFLNGVESIAKFLGKPWTIRKVRYARETGALPIRVKKGIGLYAFKSELLEALHREDSLPKTSRP